MYYKIPVRRYVLVSAPSRWAVKSERVVVQSPMLDITDASEIPVRRFNTDQENVVCFLPKEDIEKDDSDAYRKAFVDKSARDVDAHGVALNDSDSEDDFQYKRGHRFWISLHSDWNKYKTSVTVINLDTYTRGEIPIFNVCWFPKMHGPNGELWTLGGGTKIQLQGGKLLKHWTWAIRQSLSGSQLSASLVEIPAKDTDTAEKRWILPAEGQSLFQQLMKSKTKDNRLSASPPSNEQERLHMLKGHTNDSLLSPPSSPDKEEPGFDEISSSVHTSPAALSTSSWGFTFENVAKGRWEAATSPRRDNRIALSPDRRKYRRAITKGDVEPLSINTIDSSPCSCNESPEKCKRTKDGQDVVCALSLIQMRREKFHEIEIQLDKKDPLAYAVAASDDPNLIGESYNINKEDSGDWTAQMCSIRDENCTYTSRSFTKHFHLEPSKCLNENEHHEHCVGSKKALPGSSGPCILAGNGASSHKCCIWRLADRSECQESLEPEYNDVKQKEIEQRGFKFPTE